MHTTFCMHMYGCELWNLSYGYVTHIIERIILCKLRCANIKLPVYSKIFMYSTDICSLCNIKVPGDEYHCILRCPSLYPVLPS